MLSQRSPHQRSASHERSGSEGLVDLNVFVVPSDVWRNSQTSSINQIVTDSVSAGYIRVHPESFLSDMRKEIDRQIGYDAIPRDYIFLRCLGRCFTQIKPKQESELKVKYFTPPRTYSPELYIVDASATLPGRFSTSSLSSRPSVQLQPDSHSRLPPFLPPAYGAATLPTHKPDLTYSADLSYRDSEKSDELLRRKLEENLRRREDEEAEEDAEKRRRLREEEEEKRRRLREEEEEKERTQRLIEELERSRQEELEDRRRMEEEEDLRRLRRLEEEEEEDRFRLRRLIEEDGRRQYSPDHDDAVTNVSRPRTPSPTPGHRTSERNERLRILREMEEVHSRRVQLEFLRDTWLRKLKRLTLLNEHRKNRARDVWKKRFFEEKKRTVPREDNAKVLKEELDSINRKIIDQMENIRDNTRKTGPVQSTIDKAHKMKLEATKMENEIEDLQSKLQDAKLHLTAEMKLRNQSERELQFLKAELAQLKVKSLPRLDDEPQIRTVRYSNGNDEEEEEPEYDEPIEKKTTVQLTYREPKKAPKDLPSVRLPEPPPKKFFAFEGGTLEEAFRAFATKNNGLEATGADIFKWSVDAGVIGNSLNNHHVDISFCKVKPKGMKTITIKEMIPLIDELAVKYRDDTKLSFQAARKKLIEKFSKAPFKLHGATQAYKGGAVDRLTDVKKYTGLHKDRFDPKTGRGKAREERQPVTDNSGYVTNYKLAGSYDKIQ